MRIPVERLIDGVVETLVGAVLPDLRTPFARGQLYAAVDVLRNLRDRVEERAALRDAEATSAEAALRRTLEVLCTRARGAAGIGDLRDETRDADASVVVEEALREAEGAPPDERLPALRRALVAALAAVDALPTDEAAAARAPLAAHLAAQAMRDVAVLKMSLLSEISRG